jgi:hypothetical protein
VGRFVSRDSWAGNNNNPITQNKYLYANSNPIMYVDPSGKIAGPILAAILPSLIGLGAGIAVGAAAGATYGACTYEWALAGECGCDIQQKALSMTKNEWIGAHAISGSLIGGYTAALIAVPGGQIVLGAFGVVVGVSDLAPAVEALKQAGLTPCTATRIILDVAALVFGSKAIGKGIQEFRASGNLFGMGFIKPKATAPIEKFRDYIFRPGASPGKLRVFQNLGYSVEDSAELVRIYEQQAAQKYQSGQYTLGKFDNYGQRINITIDLPGKMNASTQSSQIISGWMIRENGITLNTPFSGHP